MIIKKNEPNKIKALIDNSDELKQDNEFQKYIHQGKKIIKILQGSLRSYDGGFIVNTSIFSDKPKRKRTKSIMNCKMLSNPMRLMKSPPHICTPKILFNSSIKNIFNSSMKNHHSNNSIPTTTTNHNIKIRKQKNNSTLKTLISNSSENNIIFKSNKNKGRLDSENSVFNTNIKCSSKHSIHYISPISHTSFLMKEKTYQSTQSIFQKSTYNSNTSEPKKGEYNTKKG